MVNIKLSKVQLFKNIQLVWLFGRLVEPLMKIALPLMKNVLLSLPKSVLIPLGSTAAASGADVEFIKNIFGSGTSFS